MTDECTVHMNEWTPPTIIGICRDSPAPDDWVVRCDDLGIPIRHDAAADEWVLEYADDTLSLIRPDGVRVAVDFAAGKTRHRAQEAGRGAGVLSKALGIATFRKRHGRLPQVVDGTGGWGQDAWAIASLGCMVVVLEKHPIVHALLTNGLCRALVPEDSNTIAERIKLHCGDAANWLQTMTTDVIYLDPMYPTRQRKKADSKKGMQFLHALLGPSDESVSSQLLATSLEHAQERVVVKRPKGAEPLTTPTAWTGQTSTIASPNTRYDIYLQR